MPVGAPVWVPKSAQAEVEMRRKLEYGVNFIWAAPRMRAGFRPPTTRRRQIQPLGTVRFTVALNNETIRDLH